MALRNAFENLGLDSTLQAIRDRLPAALGGNGGLKVEQQGSLPSGSNTIGKVDVNQLPGSLGTSGGVKVEQQGSLPSGTNVIGAVKIADSVGADEATVTPSGALKVDLSATSVNTTAIKVDASGSTQPVSGTVTANQGGTWDIRNVTGTVSLPSGAATAAKQPALGTAGSASTDVITVQGITSMTPIKIDGSATTQPVSGTVTANAGTNLNTSALALESGGNLASIKTDVDNLNLSQGSTTSGQKGNLILGAVTTAAPSYTTGQSNPLSLTTGGLLRIDGSGVTQPISGTVTSTQAATASNVGAYSMTDAVYSGTTALTPKFATITASASGVTTVVAAVASKRIRVLQVVLISNAAVNVKFQSHVTPTDITGLFYLGANSGFSSGYSPVGHFQTVAGEALDINLSGAVAVGGYLTYVEV